MRRERFAVLLPLWLCACVQDVDLGLGDGGTLNDSTVDSGVVDTGVDAGVVDDSGPTITCTGAGVECVNACQAGFTPRPDLTCEAGSVCCSTEQTTCTDTPPECRACGQSYPPECVGTEWMCPTVECNNCNVDSECQDFAFEYCDNDFALRDGACTLCPAPPQNPCIGGTLRDHRYGKDNGCHFYECECPAGTTLQPDGCEGPGGWLELDPSTLTFFSLPIGSLRFAVSGFDPNAQTCVTVVWFINSVDDGVPRCGATEPYVIVTPNSTASCGQWSYDGNVTVDSALGCYDFADFVQFTPANPEVHLNLVDMDLAVTSTTFTGNIRISNRRWSPANDPKPWPVSFTLRYLTDVVDAPLWIQNRDFDGRQSWVKLFADGVELPIGGGCDVSECNGPDPGCTTGGPTGRNIVAPGANDGSASLTWDGWVYNMPTGAACFERQAAHPRDYELEFCFGRGVDMTGVVNDVTCERVPFTYPTDEVEWLVDEGA